MSTPAREPCTETRDAPGGALLSLTDAAIMAQVDPNTLARWANRGRVTAVRGGSGGWRKFCEAEMQALAPGKMMAIGQAAYLLRRNPKTVALWSDEGRLDCVRLPGGMRRFLEEDVLALAAAMAAGTGDG